MRTLWRHVHFLVAAVIIVTRAAAAPSITKQKILVALPSYGFDPSEVAIPWRYFKMASVRVRFATPDGKVASADRKLLTGGRVPWFMKKFVMASQEARLAYAKMVRSVEFNNPIAYRDIEPADFDGLILPGGHHKALRPYLESTILQEKIAMFFDDGIPVGAIDQGVLAAARSISIEDPRRSGKSVLWDRRTTSITRRQGMITYYVTRPWLGEYYRTYTVPMETELRWYLKNFTDFVAGPGFPFPWRRDCEKSLSRGFAVEDVNYISARWPGDVHRFTIEFLQLLRRRH